MGVILLGIATTVAQFFDAFYGATSSCGNWIGFWPENGLAAMISLN